jgi:two-component system phosphate regulon response regulator PhoB
MAAPSVLIIDDEEYMRCILAYKLQRAGVEVLGAVNGEEGLALARARKPDLIITDYQMPVMNGLEMARELAADPQTAAIPIIMITARSHHFSAGELTVTGIRHLVEKPFSGRELIARIAEVLNLPSIQDTPNHQAA